MSISRISSFPGTLRNLSARITKTIRSLHYDDNGFLVRPRPSATSSIKAWARFTHGIRLAISAGWAAGTSSALNLTHAFYEAVGEDTLQSHCRPPRNRQCADGRRGAFSRSRLDSLSRFHVLYFRRRQSARWPRHVASIPSWICRILPAGMFSFWNREAIPPDRLRRVPDSPTAACCRICVRAKKRARPIL